MTKHMAIDRATYKWFYDHIQSRYYNLLVQWCFLPFGGEVRCRATFLKPVYISPTDRILDICCGTGGATHTLANITALQAHLVGLDLSLGQLRCAQRHPHLSHVPFIEADAACSPFRAGIFDKVVIPHALHEMPRAMRQMVLAEARRLLKEQGAVIVLELDEPAHPALRWFTSFWFFYWLPFSFETPTRRDLLQHGLAREVAEAGFQSVTKVSHYSGIFQTVQGFK